MADSRKKKPEKIKTEKALLFFPGLAADLDMFLPLIRELARRRFPLRLEYTYNGPMSHKMEKLEDYTRRMLEEQGLMDRHFRCTVAASMGGMLAQVALKNGWIKTDQLILIATAFSGDDLHFYGKWGSHLLHYIPKFLHKPIRSIMGFLYPLVRFNNRWSLLLGQMIRQNDATLLFTAPYMIRNWRKGKSTPLLKKENIPVYHFHGTLDQLISYKKVNSKRNVEFTDKHGSHLTFVNRASEIAGVIESRCGDLLKRSK